MTTLDFSTYNLDKVSLHHFPNDQMENGDEACILYINRGQVNFQDSTRFMGSIEEISKNLYSKLSSRLYRTIRKAFLKMVDDYPEHVYQVYYHSETSFVYYVARKDDNLVVRCKMSNKSNARTTDYFTNSIETRTGTSARFSTIQYFVHSMSKTRPVKPAIIKRSMNDIMFDTITQMHGSASKFQDAHDMILQIESQLPLYIAEKKLVPVVDEKTTILRVGQYYAGGIITKALQCSFLQATLTDDWNKFNGQCGAVFDEINQLRTPPREAFRGKVWIVDMNRDIEEGYDGYENDRRAKEIIKRPQQMPQPNN